jgi:hypothetical protein
MFCVKFTKKEKNIIQTIMYYKKKVLKLTV